MLNEYTNDLANISIKWLLRMFSNRGISPQHLLEIIHISTGTSHFLLVLPDGCYACDCSMGINLGIPCRHFFQAWTSFKGLKFNISLIWAWYAFPFSILNQRKLILNYSWYQDPNLNVEQVPAAIFDFAGLWLETTTAATSTKSQHDPPILFANPLECISIGVTPPPSTQTVGACIVNQEATAALRPIIEGVRTQEELDEVLDDLQEWK